MGFFFSKPELEDMDTVFPADVVDSNKAGDTFLIVFDVSESPSAAGASPALVPKRAHHALLIDVAGESSDAELMYEATACLLSSQLCNSRGILLHMLADPQTRTTGVQARRIRCPRTRPHDVYSLGQIRNVGALPPDRWAFSLADVASQEYHSLIQREGASWSARTNCQQLTRNLVGRLSLSYPAGLQVVGDVAPDLINAVIFGLSAISALSQTTGSLPSTSSQ